MRPDKEPTLLRKITLPLLVFYGLGTILGAGIYVLVGEVAAEAGLRAPFAFLLAAIVAVFTALSYAELASRIPRSAGEAAYVHAAFGLRSLAGLAGWGVAATGIVSAATIANSFVGYLDVFIELPAWLVICVAVLVMGGLAAWGVGESVMAASIVTVIEIIGLLFVIVLAGHHLGDLPDHGSSMLPTFDAVVWGGVFMGAYLAFFAFIGFEDIVNMAEEVKQPERNVPKAILLSLGVATVLYILVALIAVLALPVDQLSGSKAPLAKILASRGQWAVTSITLISMVAVINGALIQIIMASRVIYGMARQSMAPRVLARVHPGRRTPLLATCLVTGMILVLALPLSVVDLAKITSTIILGVFTLINVSLWWLKRSPEWSEKEGVLYPGWVPLVGLLLCVGALATNYIL